MSTEQQFLTLASQPALFRPCRVSIHSSNCSEVSSSTGSSDGMPCSEHLLLREQPGQERLRRDLRRDGEGSDRKEEGVLLDLRMVARSLGSIVRREEEEEEL